MCEIDCPLRFRSTAIGSPPPFRFRPAAEAASRITWAPQKIRMDWAARTSMTSSLSRRTGEPAKAPFQAQTLRTVGCPLPGIGLNRDGDSAGGSLFAAGQAVLA